MERSQGGRGVTGLLVTPRHGTKHNLNESVCSGTEKADAQALSAPLNQPPLEERRMGGTRYLEFIFLSVLFETPL